MRRFLSIVALILSLVATHLVWAAEAESQDSFKPKTATHSSPAEKKKNGKPKAVHEQTSHKAKKPNQGTEPTATK